MKLPFELRQKDVALTAALAEEIRERAGKLEQFFDRIMRCRVTVEGPGNHHRQGLYRVKIDITVPGAEIVVDKQEAVNLERALRGAFNAATRRLEDHVRKMRGYVKTHGEP
jgi:ribosomal subunit interface protein